MLIKLSENISSHICHELANSIGALDGNIEFLESDNEYANEALSIIKQASSHSVFKLRYLRQLYGFNSSPQHLETLIKLSEDAFKSAVSKLKFNINTSEQIKFDLLSGKLFLAFIYIAYGDMPYGGYIDININHDSSSDINEVRISSISEKLKIRPNIHEILTGVDLIDEMSPRNVLAFYIKHLASEEKHRYKIVISQNRIDYIFQYKNIKN